MDLQFPLRSAFMALPLEGEVKWHFQALQEELKEYEDMLRFQNPQTPHLTMQYWASLMKIEYDQIIPQAEKVAAQASPFVIPITGAATFGSRGRDSVLYLSVAFSEELAKLKKRCPWVSDGPFMPHITLARIKHPEKFSVHKKKIMKKLEGAVFDFPVDRLRFYAEIEGMRQTPLQDFIFGG